MYEYISYMKKTINSTPLEMFNYFFFFFNVFHLIQHGTVFSPVVSTAHFFDIQHSATSNTMRI